MIDLIYCA